MVLVVNRVNTYPQAGDVYIGRGSLWGNPWKISKYDSRAQVIEKYRYWIDNDRVEKLKRLNPTRLVCYCAPLPCHGDILKAWLELDIKKYVSKPIIIEAVEVKLEDFPNIAAWCGGKPSEYFRNGLPDPVQCIEVRTLEGTLVANIGDYIIRGTAGEFYPVKDEIFKYKYSEVTE